MEGKYLGRLALSRWKFSKVCFLPSLPLLCMVPPSPPVSPEIMNTNEDTAGGSCKGHPVSVSVSPSCSITGWLRQWTLISHSSGVWEVPRWRRQYGQVMGGFSSWLADGHLLTASSRGRVSCRE